MTNQNSSRDFSFWRSPRDWRLRRHQFAGADSALGGAGAAPAAVPTPIRAHFHLACCSDYTLSGCGFRIDCDRRTPIEGVARVLRSCAVRKRHSWAVTNSSGIYSFTGVWTDARLPDSRLVQQGRVHPPIPSGATHSGSVGEHVVNGDTRFDVELVRR